MWVVLRFVRIVVWFCNKLIIYEVSLGFDIFKVNLKVYGDVV